MKKTLAKTLRSALALVLALVMVLGTVGTTFAAEKPASADSAMEKLLKVLEKYGPDAVDAAQDYVVEHGYIEAVSETASELKAALAACAAEHEFMAATIKSALAGPVAELKALKEEAETLIVLIGLYKAGSISGGKSTKSVSVDGEAVSDKNDQVYAVITIPGFGTIDTDTVDLDRFEVDKLTQEQKDAINNSGLLGDIKIEDLSDEQVEALKEAGLTGTIDPEFFTEEELAQLQKTQNQLNQIVTTIDKTQGTIDELQAKLDALQAEITRLYEAVKATDDLIGAVKELVKANAVDAALLAKEKYIQAREALFALLEKSEKPYVDVAELTIDIAKLTVEVAGELKDLSVFIAKDVVETVSNNKYLIAGAFVLTCEQFGISQDELIAIAEKIQEKAPAAYEKVKELAAELKEKAYKAYKKATTADYVMTYGSNYVAIGDATANADNSYVDLLNKALYLKPAADKSMTGALLIQDTVLDAEKIANADLITIGYSTANFAASMVEALVGAQVAWDTYLPEIGVKAVDEAMDEVDKYLEALGFSANTVIALSSAIENIAYNALAYAYELPKTISEIRAINPDAVLVVVGLDNPFENCSVAYNGHSVGIDKLMDGILLLTDAYTLAYAILADNCTFVAAPNAANDLEGSTVDVVEYAQTLVLDFEALLPNAEGQEYIKDRIYNALRLSWNYLWGDANLDGKVNYLDAMIMLQYSVRLPVNGGFICVPISDVDCRPGVNYNDATRVLQKSVNIIDKFEVELN